MKRRSAPTFVSANAEPSGNAAVAKNKDTCGVPELGKSSLLVHRAEAADLFTQQ
jgi:hypothetical protein